MLKDLTVKTNQTFSVIPAATCSSLASAQNSRETFADQVCAQQKPPGMKNKAHAKRLTAVALMAT